MGVRPRDTVPKPHVEKFSIGPTDSIINRDKPFPPVGYSCLTSLSITRVRQPAESFYGSHAMAQTFLEMLATVLQTPESFSWDLQRCCKRQKIFRETCNGVANAKKFFVGLATVLQTPKSFSWDLQRCCKRQKVFRGTCSVSANTKKFFEALAAFLQTPKSFSWHLQRPCKGQKVFQSTCSVSANARKFFEALAALLQTPKSFSWHLQHSCRRQGKRRGASGTPARGFVFVLTIPTTCR